MNNITFEIASYTVLTILYIILILFIYELNHPISIFIKRYIISDIPFLQISDDSNFHTMEKNTNIHKCRYSLFFIPFGQFKFYFITIYNKKFEWAKVLSYEEVTKSRFDSLKIEVELECDSLHHLNKEAERILILQDEIHSYKETKNLASIKGTFYITILAAMVSVLFTQINNLKSIYSELGNHVILQIIFWYVVILFINFILINIHFISVKGFYRETYDDYISDEIGYNEMKYFYKNMKWYGFQSWKNVGYVKNIEFYLIKSFIISSLFVFLYTLLI